MKEEDYYNRCDFCCEQCSRVDHCLNYAYTSCMESALPEADETPASIRAQIADASFDILKHFASECHFKLQQIFESTNLTTDSVLIKSKLQREDDIEYKVEISDVFKILVIYENVMTTCLDHVYDWLDNEDSSIEEPIQTATSAIEWDFNLIYVNLRFVLFVNYGNKCEETEPRYKASLYIILNKIQEIKQLWKLLYEVCLSLQTEIDKVEIVLDQLETELIKTFPDGRSDRKE